MTNKGHTTKQHIINKAALLFTRQGFNQTSLSQILEATGLAKGGFYFHFRSKEELGMAVIASLEDYWQNELLPRMVQGNDAREKIEIMLSSPGDCYSTPDCIRPTILLLNLATESMEVHDGFSCRLKEIIKEWWTTLEGIIEEGKRDSVFKTDVDTRSVAAIILSNIMGANLLAMLNNDPCLYEQQLASLKLALFSGISANNHVEVSA